MGLRQETPCVHRWLLSEPRLATVRAVCRRCGARRTYPLGLDYYEAVPDYEELDRSRLVLAIGTASLEERSLA